MHSFAVHVLCVVRKKGLLCKNAYFVFAVEFLIVQVATCLLARDSR